MKVRSLQSLTSVSITFSQIYLIQSENSLKIFQSSVQSGLNMSFREYTMQRMVLRSEDSSPTFRALLPFATFMGSVLVVAFLGIAEWAMLNSVCYGMHRGRV